MKTAENTRGNLRAIKSMVMAYKRGPMEGNTKVDGIKGNNILVQYLPMYLEINLKNSGNKGLKSIVAL